MDDIEKHHRQEWMTNDQWYCAQFLCDLFRGFHHIQGTIKPAAKGIMLNTRATNWAASYDFDGMTRAVVMAHDRCCRFEISSSGPGMLKLFVHRREGRDGSMWQRHPTLEDAIKTIRGA